MARVIIELPTLATVYTRVGVIEAKVDLILAALAALNAGGGTGTPGPFTYSLNFTDTRNSMYVGALS